MWMTTLIDQMSDDRPQGSKGAERGCCPDSIRRLIGYSQGHSTGDGYPFNSEGFQGVSLFKKKFRPKENKGKGKDDDALAIKFVLEWDMNVADSGTDNSHVAQLKANFKVVDKALKMVRGTMDKLQKQYIAKLAEASNKAKEAQEGVEAARTERDQAQAEVEQTREEAKQA
ncbi:hypothetical protein NE237_014939 [Protea cynaroides]|uniref:Uncharacterized protein n=1 Tax=Protea cynaroides TaxID=273540 RepID=A0A9Q0KCW7_9MAGN|nr:hypothetical protein NE237_014939 [Protea cynaroides]